MNNWVRLLVAIIGSHSIVALAAVDLAVSDNFARIQALVGEWQGRLPNGKSIQVTYEAINGGAIVERYRSEDPQWWNMSSVYHMDNGRILLSHYCSWGNHPRMSAGIFQRDRVQLVFDFLDIALTQPENGYMRKVEFEFQDADHFFHHWVWREKGEDTPLTLALSRVHRKKI